MTANLIHVFLIAGLLAGSGCATILGTEEKGDAQAGVRISFEESLRNTLSLRGEGWREPQQPSNTALSLRMPNSVYADAFRVYVTDTYSSTTVPAPRVFVFDRADRVATPLTLPVAPAEGHLINPVGIALDAANLIWVADAHQGRVFGYDANGTLVMVLGRMVPFGQLTGLAADHLHGILYVADATDHRVRAFSTTGEELFSVGASGRTQEDFRTPTAITVDRAGNLHVLDGRKLRVHVYTRRGEFVNKLRLKASQDAPLLNPGGMVLDAAGFYHITDTVRNSVYLFDGTGAFVRTWGAAGSLAGDFLTPRGIFMDNQGLIYVADQMNGRVQVFRSSR